MPRTGSLPSYSPTTDRVLRAFVESRFSFLSTPEVAGATGLNYTTVRVHVKVLLQRGYLRRTAYKADWAASEAGRRRIRDLDREPAWQSA